MDENTKIVEPIFEKWNELPPEIKLECMKSLDIKTRWNLRNTSKTERILVDRQKFKIDEMKLRICDMLDMSVRLSEKDSILELNTKIDIPTHVPLIKFILQHGIFEKLHVRSSVSIDKLTVLFPETEFISVKNLVDDSAIEEYSLFWIEKVKNRLESVEIANFDYKTTPGLLSSHEKIVDADYFHLYTFYLLEILSKLAQIWIDKDVEIGKKFLGENFGPINVEEFNKFKETISDRVISQTDRMIRIRMDNEEKHIILAMGTDENLRMTVIPSKLKVSEYRNSGQFIHDLVKSLEDEPDFSDHDEDSDDD